MRVINDAGHGETDGGASGYGFIEKYLTLEASQYVNDRLNELGIESTQTRTSDVGLDSKVRTNIVKSSGAKVCLSHHYNAFNGKASGVETIYSIYSDDKLARSIAYAIRDIGQPFRRVFSKKGTNGDYYYMHRLTGAVKTIIIEYAFLDNVDDAKRIKDKDYRFSMYEAVVKVMCEYFDVQYTPLSGFSDVSNSHWAFNAIENVFNDGIMIGMSDGLFKPNDLITRAEVAVIVNRIINKLSK